jgi:hypothetical protein
LLTPLFWGKSDLVGVRAEFFSFSQSLFLTIIESVFSLPRFWRTISSRGNSFGVRAGLKTGG